MHERSRSLLWWLSLALSSIGVGATAGGADWGPLAAVGGVITLANLAWTTFPGRRFPLHVPLLGVSGGFLAAVGALAWTWDPRSRIALVVIGFQLLLAAAAATRDPLVDRASSLLIAVLGHVTALLGVVLLGVGRSPFDAATVIGAGFSVLLVHAYWRQRARGGPGAEWETALLSCIVVVASAPIAARFVPQTLFVASAGLAALFACFAILALPPAAVKGLARPTRAVGRAVSQGVTFIVLVNVLLLAYSLVTSVAIRVVVGLLFFWLLVSVFFEYRAIAFAKKRLVRAPPAPEADPRPGEVAVLVAAADDAVHLRAAVEAHLRSALPLEVVIVPSLASVDATVEVAEALAREHPGRVRVVPGASGSKAGDLDEAWRTIQAPYLLVLDADETMDDASIRRAVHRMRSDPRIGVVQGRKVDPRWDDRWLSRFVAAERRYSTWIDQSLQAADGAGHFAGSGALIRRECLEDVDGWSDATLTEDIELTIRILATTGWRIAYEPSVLVREGQVLSVVDLVRQRTRWARGWAQVTALHLPSIWRERRRLGPLGTASLAWQLLSSVSGPWMVLLPLLSLIRLLGLSDLLPFVLALPLALVIMPARGLAYGFAAWHDPVTPVPRKAGDVLALVVAAYAWVLVGWIIQLHAIYLELAEAPHEWVVTKRRAGTDPGRRRATPS